MARLAAGSVGPGWAGQCWAGRRGEREGLIQTEGRREGQEAERGPSWSVDVRVLTRTSGRGGVPGPQSSPGAGLLTLIWAFLFYYSFHFGVTFYFFK